mgnify:CR=1 FL=1
MMKTIENVYRYYYHEAGPIEVTIILIFFFVLPCIGFFIYYAWLRNRGGVVVPVEQYSDGPIVHSNRPIVAGSTPVTQSSSPIVAASMPVVTATPFNTSTVTVVAQPVVSTPTTPATVTATPFNASTATQLNLPVADATPRPMLL